MDERQTIVFMLEQQEYGIDILSVKEIIVPVHLTKLPNMPPYFEGVFNLRGNIIPLINLKRRFSIESTEANTEKRIIVIMLDKPVGVLVDSVHEVLMIGSDTIEKSADISTGIDSRFISGIAKMDERLIILLNLEGAF